MGTRRRLTVNQAADQLGITVDAVRGRIKRGTLTHERDGDRVYVLLDADQPPTSDDQPNDQSELVEVLKEQVEDLRTRLDRETEANRENRRIIAGLIERVPELESSREEPEAPAQREEPPEDTGGPENQSSRPWWRRWFGG